MVLFDSNRAAGTVQNTKLCVDETHAEVLIAPTADRAMVAAGNAGLNDAGFAIVYANTAFVNQAAQVCHPPHNMHNPTDTLTPAAPLFVCSWVTPQALARLVTFF